MGALGLRDRLILGSSTLVVGFVLLGMVVLSNVLTAHGERQVAADLQGARVSYESHLGLKRRTLRERAALLAEMPVLLASISTHDRATIEDTLARIPIWRDRDLVVVAAPRAPEPLLAAIPAQAGALAAVCATRDEPDDLLLRAGSQLYHVACVPVQEGDRVVAILCVGERIDIETAREIAAATSHDVVLLHEGQLCGQARQDAEAAPLVDGDRAASVAAALAGLQPGTTTLLELAGMPRRALLLPLHRSGGWLLLSRDPSRLHELQQSGWTTLLAVGLATGLLGVLASLGMARRIARPLVALAEGANAMSAGDLQARVELRGDREFGQVALAFNNMATRIGGLLHDVRQQAARAEAANLAKDAFLASVSHELRTPTTNIRAYAEILAQYGPETALHEQHEFLDVILGQTQHLEALIAQVLDFTELAGEALQQAGRTCTLADIVRDALEPLRGRAGEREVALDLRLDGSVQISGDHRRLKQLVTALLDNAFRFAPERSAVEVALRRDGERAVLSVRDHGPGVPDPAKASVFEPFFQAGDHLTGKPSGIGLGLTIARTIVTAHGGTLRCEDAPGGGACFVVELPALSTAALVL